MTYSRGQYDDDYERSRRSRHDAPEGRSERRTGAGSSRYSRTSERYARHASAQRDERYSEGRPQSRRNASVPRIPLACVNAADRMSITIPLAVAIAGSAVAQPCTKSSAAKGATAVALVPIAHTSRTTTVSVICVSEMRAPPSMPFRAPGSAASTRRRNTVGTVT